MNQLLMVPEWKEEIIIIIMVEVLQMEEEEVMEEIIMEEIIMEIIQETMNQIYFKIFLTYIVINK